MKESNILSSQVEIGDAYHALNSIYKSLNNVVFISKHKNDFHNLSYALDCLERANDDLNKN